MARRLTREAPKKGLWTPDQKRWYVRRSGKYYRITAKEGTPDFDRQYWEIMRGNVPARPAKTTWQALWEAYAAGPWWAELKPRTRADYRKLAEYLLAANATRDVTQAKRIDVIRAMEANRHRVRFANYLRTFMSILFSYAQHLGWRDDNPAQGIRSLKVPKDRQAAHMPWTDAALAKFRAEASPEARLILELALGSVQRPGDVAGFAWWQYDGQSLHLVQGKTGRELLLPCGPALRLALDAARPDPCDLAARIIGGADGVRGAYYYVARVMLAERKRLGLEAFDLHGLRYRGVMELAWAGCSDEEIEAFSGHASKAMVRKYAGKARQMMRARTAAEKRERNQTEERT